jgi:hypothetical protein
MATEQSDRYLTLPALGSVVFAVGPLLARMVSP